MKTTPIATSSTVPVLLQVKQYQQQNLNKKQHNFTWSVKRHHSNRKWKSSCNKITSNIILNLWASTQKRDDLKCVDSNYTDVPFLKYIWFITYYSCNPHTSFVYNICKQRNDVLFSCERFGKNVIIFVKVFRVQAHHIRLRTLQALQPLVILKYSKTSTQELYIFQALEFGVWSWFEL